MFERVRLLPLARLKYIWYIMFGGYDTVEEELGHLLIGVAQYLLVYELVVLAQAWCSPVELRRRL